MTERSVRVLHVLVSRRVRGLAQVLLFRHPRWRNPHSGRPMLALPTTKFAPAPDSDEHVSQRLASILDADMGLDDIAPPAWQRLGDAHTRTVSPTHGVPSTYRIASVLTRLPVASHGRVARRLDGEWVSPESALGLADLSPTARAVFEQQTASPWLLPAAPPEPRFGSAAERALTVRLLTARDGDLEQFGMFVEEVRPILLARLSACPWTRALAARPHDVDDVCADAALRALDNLETFDPARGSALMWVWVITRNAAVSCLRRRARTGGLSPEAAAALASGERDPASLALAREEIDGLRARLADALEKAPPMIRRVWALRMDERRPYHEIAELLRVPSGTIATWIRRIRRQALGDGTEIA